MCCSVPLKICLKEPLPGKNCRIGLCLHIIKVQSAHDLKLSSPSSAIMHNSRSVLKQGVTSHPQNTSEGQLNVAIVVDKQM